MSNGRYVKPASVKELEQAIYEHDVKGLLAGMPGISTKHIVAPSLRDDTANGLTKCITGYIKLRGGQAERINTMGRPVTRTYTDAIGRKHTGPTQWVYSTSTRGSADISATIGGVSVKIEVKTGADRQSQAQRNYQESIERAGGVYRIARDFTSFREWYNETFGKGAGNG
jgi:hypothetical protein